MVEGMGVAVGVEGLFILAHPLPVKVEPIIVPQQLHTLPHPRSHPHAEGRRVLACDLSPYVIEGVGVTVVFERSSLHPPVAQRAIRRIPDPGRRLHLGVEVAVVDVSSIRRNPPEAGADLFIGRVEGYGAVDGDTSFLLVPLGFAQPIVRVDDQLDDAVAS